MKKLVKWVVLPLAIVFIGLQFVQPDRTNPPVDESKTIFARVQVKPEVKAIFERSCYDCHSQNTRWPWYSYVAPVSWLVAEDVKEARAHMNLSDWSQYNTLKSVAKLDQICEEVSNGLMPLPKYLTMHPKAKLTQQDIDEICNWIDEERERLLSESFQTSEN